MYTALIVDDEPDGRSLIRKNLEVNCPQFTDVLEAVDRASSLEQLQRKNVDIIFLDIELKEENGLELYDVLLEKCANIVFVTAWNKYAVDAFRVKPLHYILKPIDPDDLVEAVRRADLTQGRIVISTLGQRTVLDYEDITYMRSDGPYVHFYTVDGRSVVGTLGLKQYASRMNSPMFCRPHQSYLVNLLHVERVNLEEESYGAVYVKGVETPIAMSKRRRGEFVKALERFAKGF